MAGKKRGRPPKNPPEAVAENPSEAVAEVECIVDNVSTGSGKLRMGEKTIITHSVAEFLAGRNQVKILETTNEDT